MTKRELDQTGSVRSWLDRHLYPGVRDNWDDELFRSEVTARLTRNHTILDLGAGAGAVKQMDFRTEASLVIGIDRDLRIRDNQLIDFAVVAAGENIPLRNSSVDIVISDNVLEHLVEPQGVFREVSRVLRPGGWFLVKTPNKRHYMPLISQVAPMFVHTWYNSLRGRPAADTYKTLYKANTVKDLQGLASQANLLVDSLIRLESRPEYLRLNPLFYLVGWCYERVVNATDRLAVFRLVLIGSFRKPESESRGCVSHDNGRTATTW